MRTTVAVRRKAPLNHCRQVSIAALIEESLRDLATNDAISATKDFVRAQTVLKACDGDMTAALALLGFWCES